MASLAQMKREAEAQSMKALGAYRGSRAAEKSGMQKLQDRREQTRQDFFKGREDISPDRLDRRQIQKDLYEKFKKEQMSIVPGTTNLYQSKTPGGPTLSDEANRLARMYGPTMKEIGSDIGYGIKSIGSALGQKIGAGEFGVMGIAKALYEKFTNSAKQAKDYLGQKIDKLSDIDLEFLKGDYKLMSNKQSVQEAKQAEALSKLADQNLAKLTPYKNLFGDYYTYGGSSMPGQVTIEEQVSTPVTSKVGSSVLPASFGNTFGSTPVPNVIQQARTPDQLRLALLNQSYGIPDIEKPYLMQQDDYYYQNKERLSPKGDPYLYADASQSDIDRINKMRQLKSMDPQSIYEMKDVFQLSPDITIDEIQRIKEGTLTQPTGQYAADGGMIEKRLGDLQKKTNNIYGTGILSVR